MSMGPTMDMAIIRETFTRTLATAEMFDLDEPLRAELKDKLEPCSPTRSGNGDNAGVDVRFQRT